MRVARLAAVLACGLVCRAGLAGETAGVKGSDIRFPTRTSVEILGKPVEMVLTGTAMRTKYFLNVYAIGSYVQEGAGARDADALLRANAPKRLHLVFERAVDGPTMANAFQEVIRSNHPAPAFNAELATLTKFFQTQSMKPGSQIWLTSVPGVGLHCVTDSRAAVMVKNPAFARAAWDAYLGRNGIGVAIRSGLTSRL